MDPDGGVNVERKRRELVNAGGSGSVDLDLTVSFPNDGWTKSLKKLPDVRFPSIYQHFMEKSLVVAARMSLASVGDDSDATLYVYTPHSHHHQDPQAHSQGRS